MKSVLLITFVSVAAGQTPTFERVDLPGLHIAVRGLFNRNRPVDVNRDGKADIIGVLPRSAGGPALVVYTGLGGGRFAEPSRFDLTNEDNLWIAGDFNGDGNVDLVVEERRCCLRLLRGDGLGGFSPGPSTAATSAPVFDWVAADVNRDGNTDLVVHWNYYPLGRAQVLLGRADGTFEIRPEFQQGDASELAAGDFDGDGNPDVAFAPELWGFDDDLPSVWFGDGNGEFVEGPPLPVWNTNWGIAAADFNRDGRDDFVLGGLVVLLANGGRTFRRAPLSLPGEPTDLGWLMAHDVNGDGIPDLLYSGRRLRTGLGDGTFSPPLNLGEDTSVRLIGDFNDDARPDLLAHSQSGGAFLLSNTTPVRLSDPPLASPAGVAISGIAPQSVVSLFGSFLGSSDKPQSTRVRAAGHEARLLYVSPTQINAYFESVGPFGPASLEVVTPAGEVSAAVNLVESAPAIFTLNGRGSGPGLVLHGDGTPVTAERPALVNEPVRIIATGLGLVPHMVRVTIGGASAPVLGVATAPMPLPFQVLQVLIPPGAATGADTAVDVVVAGVRANPVSIAVSR